jgi:cyclohexyl-isocyanide hydratase
MPDVKISLVWKTLDPVVSQFGLKYCPDSTIVDNVKYDLVLVPGGYDCARLMIDLDILEWLKRQSESVEYLTSVCTGSLVLVAAGLLRDCNAACHWSWSEHLRKFEAYPTRERVVVDGNRITAAGVTAGIDFALKIVEMRCGSDLAEQIVLSLEYDPAPISGGVPETARSQVVDAAKTRVEMINKSRNYTRMIDQAATRLLPAQHARSMPTPPE